LFNNQRIFEIEFLFPNIRNTFKVNGAVNAKAQGQATISTAVNTLKAIFASIKTNSQILQKQSIIK
jgi:hypothetical protein